MDWDEVKQKATGLLEEKKLNKEYYERLKVELYEIEKQGANSNWCDQINAGTTWDANPKGLVLPWLLDLTQVDPIVNKIKHNWIYQTDTPDIDLDYMPFVRDIIKDFATKQYIHVCSVGSWVTYKPKSALQDVTRAYGGNLKIVVELTTNLPEEFDDLTLIDHKKLQEDLHNPDPKIQQEAHQEIARYQPFYDFAIANPKVVDMAYRLVGKIRAQGTHSGGIIIADRPIDDIVPMSYLHGNWTSQWTEGRKTQLSKFGLVKFDILGVKTIYYIWQAGNLIKKNYNIEIDWSNIDPVSDPPRAGEQILPDGTRIPILFNDPEALKQCNDLKTDSVFQIETPIQKRIIQDGKVKSFNDLVIYNAMGRPGPMSELKHFVENRDDVTQKWKEELDPRIVDILRETSGILCYQEQLSATWMSLAGFTVPEAEAARKIISKKWVEKLPQVEKQWIEGATKTIGKEAAEHFWELMRTFGRYAFNKCLSEDSIVEDSISGIQGKICDIKPGFHLKGFDLDLNEYFDDEVVGLIESGEQDVYEVEFDNGVKVECTLDHKFLCKDMSYRTVKEIVEHEYELQSYDNIRCES